MVVNWLYKISCVLRTLWLVSYHVYIRLCKHGDITAYFTVLYLVYTDKSSLGPVWASFSSLNALTQARPGLKVALVIG